MHHTSDYYAMNVSAAFHARCLNSHGVCECLQFNDDWTPAHLTGGPTNLYKQVDLALKGEESRQPGLVALAAKLATSAGEHKPIQVQVPSSYEPKTGANVGRGAWWVG
jgi:hypothetical protein